MPNHSKQPTHGILYEGPSLIDGAPIVAIAVFSRANRKTGGMLQTYILRADMAPLDAIRSGDDASICGDCPHRGNGKDYATRSCYVNVAQGPLQVFRAYQRGKYPRANATMRRALGAGRMVRLGTYGDPAAVPASLGLDLVSRAEGHTGYTHQWQALEKAPDAARVWRSLVMASADTPAQAAAARAAGWRTFRVRRADEPLMPSEFACPASAEAGHKAQCATCKACGGTDGRKGSPAIIAHGTFAKRFPINVVSA